MDRERQSKKRGRLATHIAEAIDQGQFDDVRSLSSWAVVARLPFGVQHSYRTAVATYVPEAIGVARVGLVGLGYQSDSLRQSRNRLLELANQIAEFWKAAGIEVDGILRSVDQGDTWVRIPVPNEDIHSMVIGQGDPKRVFALTPRELYVTTDMGESWEATGTKRSTDGINGARYQRWLVQKPDDHRVMFMGTGSFNVGDCGNIFRSMDFGQSWEPVPLSKNTNSTVFGMHTNAADPNRVVACSVNGEVWASDDMGDTWRLIEHTFGELNCIAWQPNSEQITAEHTPTGMQAGLGGNVIVPRS